MKRFMFRILPGWRNHETLSIYMHYLYRQESLKSIEEMTDQYLTSIIYLDGVHGLDAKVKEFREYLDREAVKYPEDYKKAEMFGIAYSKRCYMESV